MWQRLREAGSWKTQSPTPRIYAIVELEKMGKLLSLVTQNVDNLHQKAGTSEERIRELHGNMQRLVCLNCGTRYPISLVREHYADSDAVPACEYCRGILKPDVIFFGEALPEQTLAQAMREAGECDVMLVIGSSLVVYPAGVRAGAGQTGGRKARHHQPGADRAGPPGGRPHRCGGRRNVDENLRKAENAVGFGRQRGKFLCV